MKVFKHLAVAFIAGLVGLAFLDEVLTDPPGASNAYLLALSVSACGFIICVDQIRRAYRKLVRDHR